MTSRESALHAIWQSSSGWVIRLEPGTTPAPPDHPDPPSTPPITAVVKFPGWASKAPGPDFRDAILVGPTGELRGDVAIHRDSRDWFRHGHSDDPRYANVVLHVIAGPPTGSSNEGRSANTENIALPRYVLNLASAQALECGSSGVPGFPCSGSNPLDTLHALGVSRFAKRAAQLLTRLETTSGTGAYDQIAWEEIAIAFGYGGNEAPMQRCAQSATLGRIRQVHTLFQGVNLADAVAESYLLGIGGFLTQEAPTSETTPLGFPLARARDLWKQIEHATVVPLPVTTDPRPTWSTTSVRPKNKPVRRLASLAHLMSNWSDDPDPTEGTGYGLAHSAQIEYPGNQAENSMLVRVAMILTRRYEKAHGKPRAVNRDLAKLVTVPATLTRPTLVGPARAADIVVNVLLPFASAWGMLTGNEDLSKSAYEVHASHPALSSNWITREVGRRIGIDGHANPRSHRASFQQAMIDRWEGPCRPLACTECPLRDAGKKPGLSRSGV